MRSLSFRASEAIRKKRVSGAVRAPRLGVALLVATVLTPVIVSTLPAQEPVAWQLLDDGDPDPGEGTLAFDAWRQRLVRTTTGGGAAPPFTWELVGEDWVRRFIAEPTPWGAGGACSAFDDARGVLVLAAVGQSQGLFETWEYNGTSWVLQATATSPPARHSCGLAYDSVRQQMVLFGGYSSGVTGLGDTWEYDGLDWAEVQPKNSPLARGDAGMAFDSDREVVVLVAGRDGGTRFRDTWEYDGRDWKHIKNGDLPSDRSEHGMAFDADRQKVVLFGGSTGAAVLEDTWEWDGSTWIEIVTPNAPEARRAFAMAYDGQRQAVVGHGGRVGDRYANDTWAYDGSTWTRVAVSGVPSARFQHALVFDPQLDVVVLYGGQGPPWDPDHADTWHYGGGTWALQEGAGQPTATHAFGLAFDATGIRLVGYSGQPDENVDVHEYSGAGPTWISTPSAGPDGRQSHGWVNAPGLGGNLLFGGNACCDTWGMHYPSDETWVLQGLIWLERFPATRPPARHEMGLAYLAHTGQVVLYGGRDSSGLQGMSDTWLYDGQDWSLSFETSAPGERYGPSLVGDSSRRRVVLFGGGPPLEGVTWEYDGSAWLSRPTPFQPDSNRCWTPVAYDSEREVAILFGGRTCGAEIYFNDTWAYGPDPDGDGIVGGLDNCTQTPNSDQANQDGDPAGDVCDCAVGDPGSFEMPVEVMNVRLEGGPETRITWDDQGELVGPDVVYDLVTGLLSDLVATGGYDASTCLASGIVSAEHSDPRLPPPGDGFYYLVGAVNACGTGTFGPGREVLDASSPCGG